MVDATVAAKKSSSFDLVEKEINNTIEQAELCLDRFQENRESGEDLQNCIDYINQLRGIFTLIELQGGTVLCQEIVAIANDVPVGANEDKDGLLASLSQALFVLRRYTEYFERRREDHPELLLEIINALRIARKSKPLPDSYFFEIEFERGNPKPASQLKVDAKVFEYRSRRLRHMYQVGLLNLLNNRDIDIGFKLISRAGEGFHRLCSDSSLAELWHLVSFATDLMVKREMRVTLTRLRLFVKIEKYAKEIAKLGKVATAKNMSETVARELIYIIAISGDDKKETADVLKHYGVQAKDFNEIKLTAHRSYLMGPGSDVLNSLSKALHEEIHQLKDRLDIVERGIETQEDSTGEISELLHKLADTLLMLDLKKLSDLARSVQHRVVSWEQKNITPDENDLMQIADSVLSIEQAVMQLEDDGLTIETDKIATKDQTLENSPYLAEAHIVVIAESQSGISLAKRAITAYLESGGDKLHLANVPATLESVSGALVVIEQDGAANSLRAILNCIQEKLVDAVQKPDDHILETLADALTSLEYYVDSLGRSEGGNAELLNLAEESVKTLGYKY